jgi:isoleucyl-tRNA synthetase
MDEALNSFNLYGVKNAQMLDFPKVTHEYGEEILNEYKWILKLRADVLKGIEIVRRNNEIGSAQQARVIIEIKDNTDYLNKYNADEFAKLFIVSSATLVKTLEDVTFEGDVAKVKVLKAEGIKCDRCWNYVDNTFEISEGEHLCERCHEVVHE